MQNLWLRAIGESELCPLKILLEVLTPQYQNVTLYGNRVNEDVISQAEIMEMGPGPIWLVSLLKGGIWTQMIHAGRTSCKDESKDWDDVSTSKGTPKTSRSHYKLGERPEMNSFS